MTPLSIDTKMWGKNSLEELLDVYSSTCRKPHSIQIEEN